MVDSLRTLFYLFDSFLVHHGKYCHCRRAGEKKKTERGIYVKHFKNIPMADMEIVLVSSFADAFS